MITTAMTQKTYLDHNATSPLKPAAFNVMEKIMKEPLNASSIHEYGRTGRKIIEESRMAVAKLIGAPPAQVIFNSGATEGNNTVLNEFKNERILVSAIEHPSVLEATPNAERIPVTKSGIVDLAALELMLKKKPAALVSVMMANNETGIIQPIEQISTIAKNSGALFHCDAVQAAGRTPIDMQALGIDFLTLSAHKMGGPQGVGALALGMCGITPTLLHGGGQEKKARAGTENIAGIAGFGKAAELAIKINVKDLKNMRTELEKSLIQSGAKIYGQDMARLPNTTLFSIPGIKAETALMAMDLAGIAISNGSACTSGTVKPSHVLTAMDVPKDEAAGALRISTGWNTHPVDIQIFIEKFREFLNRKNSL